MRYLTSSYTVNVVGLLKCAVRCSPDAMGYVGKKGGGLTVVFADYSHWCLE